MQQIRRLSFSRGKQGEQVIEMLEQTQRRLEEHKDIFNSASGKISIYKAVSTILLKKGAYKELERGVFSTVYLGPWIRRRAVDRVWRWRPSRTPEQPESWEKF